MKDERTDSPVKIFDYIPELDAFAVTPEYDHIATELGLAEWNPVVWIGRLFMRDNDFGEHWFDGWKGREERFKPAKALGYDSERLLIVDPSWFTDGKDGPCHTDEQRKAFWTDVLRSLHLSLDTLFEEARQNNDAAKKYGPKEDRIPDLGKRMKRIRAERRGGVVRRFRDDN